MTNDDAQAVGLGCLFGFVAGGIVGLVVGVNLFPRITQGKVNREEGKPAAMRLYRRGIDQIIVDPENDGSYVPLHKHLETIQDLDIRNLERARIENLVKWYTE